MVAYNRLSKKAALPAPTGWTAVHKKTLTGFPFVYLHFNKVEEFFQ